MLASVVSKWQQLPNSGVLTTEGWYILREKQEVDVMLFLSPSFGSSRSLFLTHQLDRTFFSCGVPLEFCDWSETGSRSVKCVNVYS